MGTYYIYHIPGLRFGCTENLKRRKSKYPRAIREIIELYEVLVNYIPYQASKREWELNLQYGYSTGWPYTAVGYRSLQERAEGGRRGVILDQCPHCGMKSNRAILTRWHFDKCPKKACR